MLDHPCAAPVPAPHPISAMRWTCTPTRVARTERSFSTALWRWSRQDTHEVSGLPLADVTIVSVIVAGDFVAEVFKDGRLRHRGRCRPGTVQLMQAGVRPRALHTGAGAVFHFYVPDALLAAAAEECRVRPERLELVDPGLMSVPQIAALAQGILQEPPSTLLDDAMGAELATCLVRHWSSAAGDVRAAPSWEPRLAPWQRRRALELLEARCEHAVSLAELAAEVRLSPFHFARAFRATLGLPPHRFQVAMRVARARALLTETERPISDIALTLGYADLGYFARLFRRHTGLTPGAYRRARCA